MRSYNALSRALSRDRTVITYRPEVSRLLGDPLAAIAFQQVLFHSIENDDNAFSKFFAPCAHPDYVQGDSWTEELAMTRDRFVTALERISTKIRHATGGDTSTNDIAPYFDADGVMTNASSLIAFWTDGTRKSWFQLNVDLAEALLQVAYMPFDAQQDYIFSHQRVREDVVVPMVGLLPMEPLETLQEAVEAEKAVKRKRTPRATNPDAPKKPRSEGETALIVWWNGKGKDEMNRPVTGEDVKMFRAILTKSKHYGWNTDELIRNIKRVVAWMRADSWMTTQISSGFISKKLPNWWDEVGSKELSRGMGNVQSEELPAYIPAVQRK